jgi:hypothetical protein
MSMNAVRAIAAYNAKLVPANVAADLTAQLPDMQATYASSATALYTLEGNVKGALQALEPGVTIESVEYPFYYAFAKKIYRMKRRFPGGHILALEVDRYKTVWTARGLNTTALAAIVTMMGVSAP